MDQISTLRELQSVAASLTDDDSALMESVLQKLRPWQPSAVGATLNGLATGNFLNGSELGTGKTFCSMAAVKLMQCPALVLCRIGARTMWKEVADYFGVTTPLYISNRESIRTGHTLYGYWEFSETRHDTGARERHFVWTLPKDTLLILDELHHDSAIDSLNSKMLRGAVKQGIKILGLSGTAAQDPRKMRGIGYMLGLHNDNDFYQWLYRQGATKDSWTCGMPPGVLESSRGKTILAESRRDIMAIIHESMTNAGRFVRVRKSDIPGFPKCVIEPEAVEFDSPELKTILSDMAAELARLKAASSNPKADAREIMIRAMQKAELLMVPGIVEETEDAIAEGQSVAIFVNYTETVRALAKRLGTDCVYTGQEKADVRETNRQRFQSNSSRIIILNSAAGSESIGLADLTGDFPRLGVVLPGFNSVQLNQILGRLPRDGAKSVSTYRLLFAAGTVQESAYRACKAKTERYAAFNGDTPTFEDGDLTAGLAL